METPAVLFENSDFVVLNKPSGWFSIPARAPKPDDKVLTEWIKSTLGFEPWVVHRIDRFTSGVILFARSKAAHAESNKWFEDRIVKKIYHFLAAALPGSALPGKPAIQIKAPVDGKPSQTLFEVSATFLMPDASSKVFYGRATPLTGRFHQIRAHAQEGKFPLLGDTAYGFDPAAAGVDFPRVALHAYELTFPFGKVQAPLPADMADFIKKMEKDKEAR